jgi:uncharacterized membrane protein YsdA (DUF1294 family)
MNIFITAAAVYITASLVTFVAFARDKRAASRNQPRTPERTLHILELLGGFPGALLSMPMLRHKNRRPRYWLVTLAITGVHAAAWTLYLTRAH